MPDLSDGVNWSEVDANNNQTPPNGWPEGQMPSTVNDCARADRGALKRFWDKLNPVQNITAAGAVYTFTTGNSAYPTAYVAGEIYCFHPNTNSVGGDQIQVNALGPKPILKHVAAGSPVPIIAYEILSSTPAQVAYDPALNAGAGAFLLLNPQVPISGDGTGLGITVTGTSYLGTVNAAGPTTLGGTNINGHLTVQNGETVAGGLNVDTLGVNSGLAVHGGGNLTGGLTADNITVSGNLTSGTITANGQISANGGLAVHSGGNLTGGLTVDNLTVSANLTSGTITANGQISANGGIAVHSGGNLTGGFNFDNVTLSGNLNVPGTSYLGTVNAAGSTTLGGTNINGNLTITGNQTVGYNLTSGTITSNGDLTVSGNAYKPGDGPWSAISDTRVKRDIAPYTAALDTITKLSPITYKYNGLAGTPENDKTYVGLVADDVQSIMPEMVGSIRLKLKPADEEETTILTTNAGALTYALLNSCKELAERVAALEAQIAVQR